MIVDDAYVTIKGASVAVISSMFGPKICRGIQESQLRQWEIENGSIETTDCITAVTYLRHPYNSTIHLRLGFGTGFYLIDPLHALPNDL